MCFLKKKKTKLDTSGCCLCFSLSVLPSVARALSAPPSLTNCLYPCGDTMAPPAPSLASNVQRTIKKKEQRLHSCETLSFYLEDRSCGVNSHFMSLSRSRLQTPHAEIGFYFSGINWNTVSKKNNTKDQ